MTSQPANVPADAGVPAPEQRTITVRRAPKFVPFMIAGALLGMLVAGVMTVLSPGGEQFELASIFSFFTVMLMVPGAGLGAVAALLIDRLSVRRTRRAVVESVPDSVGDPGAEDEIV